MTPALVEASDVTRRFGKGETALLALQPASFTITRGDRIALVGPSGSGKSTVLNLIAGLDDATHGTITWPDIGNRDALRPLAVGMIHQFSSLVPTFSLRENVALPLRLGHRTDGDAAVADAVEAMGLGGLADRMPGELSGGQAQRAAIARTLAHAPSLLIADEPTGQLDRTTAQDVLDAILSHASTDRAAIIIATHDPSVAARMATVWRMERGHLQTDPAGDAE
jgi:ABC-type lipoprotein export system ATPase subunit